MIMTAHVIPTVLDPLNASALNKLPEAAQPLSKKRKFGHDTTTAGQIASSSIVIRAHAASLSDEPLVLDRIATLPRARLPLSWLEDASWSHSDAQPGGLFVADIPALENELCACAEPIVLAVRLVADSSLYVVERVKRSIYSLTRLARWVNEGDVVVAVKGWQGSSQAVDMNIEVEGKSLPAPDALNWWQAAQVEEPLSDLGLGDDFAELQVDVVFEDEVDVGTVAPSFVDVLEFRGHSIPLVPKNTSIDTGASFALSESQGMGPTDAMDVDFTDNNGIDAKQSPEELLNGMRDHYLQALYISKTSLAYFAKGPMTRCRTYFQSSSSGNIQTPSELIEFYREAILAAKKMDLKYREALPAAVREAVLAVSDGEGGTKKRKSKKKKMSKNGLYPEEDSFIHKWWKGRSMTETSAHENSRDAETKKHISDLRLREIQLQILLILEVMALESIPALEKKDGKPTKDIVEDKDSTKKPRPKKPQDLNVLLELHLDRLCIWHAVGLEESSTAETARTSAFNEGHMSGKKVESDAVRDFCTEVIIPFYAARLPGKCKLITRKFGVSGGISPAAKKSSNKRERPEPGAEVKRQAPPQNIRRSLQRVLTDEKAAAASQNRHPSLHRSNTAPSKQETKRDSMEPLLPTVLSGNVRGGIQIKRVENREVDLNAAARQHESKLRKVQMLADQKRELDAAIHALRKPNREMVAKDIADDATKRVSNGGGSSRKPKNPVRNPYGQGVQVMATPRGNRKKDAVVGMPPLPRSLKPSKSFAGEMGSHSLAESPIMIPSSSRRAISFSGPDSNPFKSRHAVDTSDGGRRQARPAELGSIQETPTRPPPNRLLFDTNKPSSTDPRRVSSSASTGADLFRVPQIPEPRANPTEPMAPSTPVSSRRKQINPTSTPEASRPLSNIFEGARSSMIMETPPKQRGPETMPAPRSIPAAPNFPVMVTNNTRSPSSPVVFGTPVKGAAVIPVTPDKSQSKSIYDQLGWDDDDMDIL